MAARRGREPASEKTQSDGIVVGDTHVLLAKAKILADFCLFFAILPPAFPRAQTVWSIYADINEHIETPFLVLRFYHRHQRHIQTTRGDRPMPADNRVRWGLLIALNLFCWYMLGLQQPALKAQQSNNGDLPFANSVVQRFDTIDQLKQINAQLKEQNTFLRSGNLRVVVTLDPQAAGSQPNNQR